SYDPAKRRGEIIIEGFERTLQAMPAAQDIASIRSIIAKALSEHTEQGMRRHLGLLVGSFPNARPNDGEVYAAALLFDVADLKIPDAIVAQACLEIRRTHKFIPAIAEFLSVADRIWCRWRHYQRSLDLIEQRRAERIKAIAVIKSHLESAL